MGRKSHAVLPPMVKVVLDKRAIDSALSFNTISPEFRLSFENVLKHLNTHEDGRKKIWFKGSIVVIDTEDQHSFFRFEAPPDGFPPQVSVLYVKEKKVIS